MRLLAVLLLLGIVRSTSADFYINEIFFDPGGKGSDLEDEFIELRGTPGVSLANHYLIFLENELDEFGAGQAGEIENIFDLSITNDGQPAAFGSNGFLTLRQKATKYTPEQISPLANHYVNTKGNDFSGYGNGPETSSIGASSSDSTVGVVENSGFTAMLIRNDSGPAPALGDDLDFGNDGLDIPNGREGWTILDSIGVFSEPDETEFGRLYGWVNFGSDDPLFPLPSGFTPNIEHGAEFELLQFEVEALARWGNSTGHTVQDWHATNYTDSAGSGSLGIDDFADFRQSGEPHPANDNNDSTPAPQPSFVESNKGVPYGVKLTNSIGSPNYITGDYNRDGVVDAADYTVWRDSIGDNVGSEANHPLADGNHDFNVDDADYALWRANYGAPGAPILAPMASVGQPVPEPSATIVVVVALGFGALATRRLRGAAKQPLSSAFCGHVIG
jgi:hypothetical protein